MGVSRLSHPVNCIAYENNLYFIEQGRIPAVKVLKQGNVVQTLISGAPFKNLTDICCGNPGTLFVCDRGHGCIWQIEIDTGRVSSILSTSDIHGHTFEIDTNISNNNNKDHNKDNNNNSISFIPSGIVKVAEGAYLVSDFSKHQVYRFMTPECTKDALIASRQIYLAVDEVCTETNEYIDHYIQIAQKLRLQMLEVIIRLWRTKELILNKQFSNEITRILPFVSDKLYPKDGLVLFLKNAPSFVAIESFLRNIPLTSDTVLKFQEALILFVQEYDFSSPLIVNDIELHALTNIFLFSLPIAGQDLFCKILKDDK